MEKGKDVQSRSPQKTTRSPVTGPLQPLTVQKTTTSPGPGLPRPLAASPTLRQRGR
jgi:hypothetical protein